jgi:N-acetyl-gamma-glutamyl-phosphate reductase
LARRPQPISKSSPCRKRCAKIRRHGKKALQDATIVLLCLPDDAAKEAAAWLADTPVRILDASTAHRLNDSWVYGLPELIAGQREQIAKAKTCGQSWLLFLCSDSTDSPTRRREVNRERHAAGDSCAIGLFRRRRSMIERWEDPKRKLVNLPHEAPYSIGKLHKHIPEIMRYGRSPSSRSFFPTSDRFAAACASRS